MNILYLTNHFNTGGITSYVLTLARSFSAGGDRVLVASSGGNMVFALEKLGGKHVRFPYHIKSELHPGIFWETPRLTRLINEADIQIVHAQTRVTQMAAALAAPRAQVPWVSTCHGFFNPHFGRHLCPLWGRQVIAISPAVKDHLLRDLGATPDQVALVPNGIDLRCFAPVEEGVRQALKQKHGLGHVPVVGIIARLSDVKGHRYLIEAMPLVLARIPGAVCLIIGLGPTETLLRQAVRKRGLEKNIIFMPTVDRTQDLLPLIDVFVMPSVQEGLGLAVLEAAAMGIPTVASRVGGLCDIIRSGETGLLVPSQDPQALAKGLLTLLSDPILARKMGGQARRLVQEHYNAEHMALATGAVYRRAMTPPGVRS